MTCKIKRRSLRCGGRPKADFGSIFTTFIAPALGVAGSVADSAISKTQVSKSNTKPAVKETNTEVTNNNTSVENLPTIQVPTKEPISGLVTSNTIIPSDPTKTPTMRLGGRKKCWIGAAIGAATSIAGSLFGNGAKKREMRRQKSIQDWQNTTQEAANMTTALNNSQDYQEDYLRQFRTAARLGKTLGAKGIYITDGGDATKIGNNTYLLRGGSHEDVNETGQTGIGINVGGNEVEAEGGEVAQKKNGALRIFSAQPILGNGMSPAQAVMRGANKDKVFNAQQQFKRRNHLSDDGGKAKNGTAVPYKRIHINEDGTFTDTLTGKNYNTSATNGEDVVITGKANHWKEAGKRNINSYSPYSSIKQIAKDYLYKKLDNWVDKNILEPNNYDINKIKRTLYNKLDPFGYNKKDSLGNVVISPDQKIKTALNPKTPNRNFLKNDVVVMRNPIYAKYLGLKDYYNGYSMVNTDDNLKISNYSPTIGNQGNIYYKSPTESDSYCGPFSDKVLARAFKTRDNKGKNTFVSPHYDDVMGHYTTSFGKDKKGKYISYYDIWDLNPFEGTPIENGDIGERYGIGKPVHLYNRKYYTDADSTRIMNEYNRLRHLRLGGRIIFRNGGLTSKDRGSSKHPYPSVSSKDFAGGGRSYPIPTKADAVDALRLAGLHGRSDVRSKVYSKYPSLRKKSLLGSCSRPVKGIRPKAATGIFVPYNKRYTSIYDAPDYNSDYNGGNVLGNGEVTVTAKRIKPTFMKPNNDAMNIINHPANETPYIPQRHNRSRTIFSGGDYLGLGIDTLAALSTGLVNYNTAGKYTLPDRAPIIQASKLPTTYNVNPEIEEVKRYRDRLTGQTFNNTSSSVAALNRSSAINLDALSNLSKLWATKENEENKMLTEDAKNQQTVAAQNVQNELARQSEIARIKNEAIQAKGDALNVGLSGLSQAWTNFWTAGRTAYEDDQARRAMIASSKDATPTRLMEVDFDLSPDVIAALYRTAKEDRTKRFYLSRLSPKQRQKYGIN